MGPHLHGIGVQHHKAVNNVGTERCIYVLRLVLAQAGPVPSPVGEVADHLVARVRGGDLVVALTAVSVGGLHNIELVIIVISAALAAGVRGISAAPAGAAARSSSFAHLRNFSVVAGAVGDARILALGHGEHVLDGGEERVGSLAAAVVEVVQVERPDHAAAKTHLAHVLGLKRKQKRAS